MQRKITLSILLTAILGFSGFAQELVPNGSFESITNNQIDNWDVLNGTVNVQQSITVTNNGEQETQTPTFGNNMLVMQNSSTIPVIATKRFAYNQRPKSIVSQIMYLPQNGNERYLFYVLLSKWDADSSKRDTILSANITGGNAVYPWNRLIVDMSSAYTSNETPDSAYILIAPSINNGAAAQNTTLVLDDVKLVNYTASQSEIDDHFVGDISLSPNPMTSRAKLKYQINTKTNVKVDLYDITGKHIKNVLDEEQNYGNYNVDVERGDLPAGVYFCKIQTGSYTKTIKLVIND